MPKHASHSLGGAPSSLSESGVSRLRLENENAMSFPLWTLRISTKDRQCPQIHAGKLSAMTPKPPCSMGPGSL